MGDPRGSNDKAWTVKQLCGISDLHSSENTPEGLVLPAPLSVR
jgi:hypothetical protein